MLVKRLLVSLLTLGAIGTSGVGIYYVVNKANDQDIDKSINSISEVDSSIEDNNNHRRDQDANHQEEVDIPPSDENERDNNLVQDVLKNDQEDAQSLVETPSTIQKEIEIEPLNPDLSNTFVSGTKLSVVEKDKVEGEVAVDRDTTPAEQ